MFLKTRACGPRPLKVILESSRSLRAYKRILPIWKLHFVRNWPELKLHITWAKGHSRSFFSGVGHSVHVPYLRKKFSFQQFKQGLVTYYCGSCEYLLHKGHSRSFSKRQSHKICTFNHSKIFSFQQFIFTLFYSILIYYFQVALGVMKL
jgi:hypothetical protein